MAGAADVEWGVSSAVSGAMCDGVLQGAKARGMGAGLQVGRQRQRGGLHDCSTMVHARAKRPARQKESIATCGKRP